MTAEQDPGYLVMTEEYIIMDELEFNKLKELVEIFLPSLTEHINIAMKKSDIVKIRDVLNTTLVNSSI